MTFALLLKFSPNLKLFTLSVAQIWFYLWVCYVAFWRWWKTKITNGHIVCTSLARTFCTWAKSITAPNQHYALPTFVAPNELDTCGLKTLWVELLSKDFKSLQRTLVQSLLQKKKTKCSSSGKNTQTFISHCDQESANLIIFTI